MKSLKVLLLGACVALCACSSPTSTVQTNDKGTQWQWENGTIVVETPQRPADRKSVIGLALPKMEVVRVGFVGLVGGVFFATNPVLTFFMPAGGGLLAGPIYLLLIAKVHKRWSLSIMGVIMGIIWFVTGMHWAFALGYLIMAIVADFVAGAGQYKSKKLNSLSYILFSLGGTGSYIVFFVDPNGWAQTMLGNGTEQSYIDTMQATANTGILIAMFAAVIITSAISAFVGCKMLKKQFEKAGITA